MQRVLWAVVVLAAGVWSPSRSAAAAAGGALHREPGAESSAVEAGALFDGERRRAGAPDAPPVSGASRLSHDGARPATPAGHGEPAAPRGDRRASAEAAAVAPSSLGSPTHLNPREAGAAPPGTPGAQDSAWIAEADQRIRKLGDVLQRFHGPTRYSD